MSQVIAICGTMGSGKSTMLRLLSAQLPNCVTLQEDDYNPAPMRSLTEVQEWWDRGGRVEEFDLSALSARLESCTALSDGIVLLETQFGRLHPELRPWIDLQIWIDVDSDVALARKVAQLTRQLMDNAETASSPESLNWLACFCESYLQTTRKLFIRQRTQVGEQSDARIVGTGSPRQVCQHLHAALSPLVSGNAENDNAWTDVTDYTVAEQERTQ